MILDNLIAQGKATPMILVSSLTYGSPELIGNLRDSISLPGVMEKNNERLTASLLDEVLPQVEHAYRASTDRAEHAIAGMSMGGALALYVGLKHMDRFASVASFSGAVPMWSTDANRVFASQGRTVDPRLFSTTFPTLSSDANGRLHLLWIACGTSENLLPVTRQFKDWLKSKRVKFTDVETPGAHNFSVWRRNLVELAQQLFRDR